MLFDVVLTANFNERTAAQQHLHALSPGDVVVFDRGSFSSTLLTVLHQRNIHPVFRIPQSSVTAFREGDQDDVHLNLMPPKDALRNMQANGITSPKRTPLHTSQHAQVLR
ncbi:MAG: transposase [Aestuariivita sp.]|nr:transposase [Aestuariivita sp.]